MKRRHGDSSYLILKLEDEIDCMFVEDDLSSHAYRAEWMKGWNDQGALEPLSDLPLHLTYELQMYDAKHGG
jgi:hypothetical protein